MPCKPSVPPVMLEKRSASASSRQRDAERHHQPGQIDAADHEKAGEEADDCGAKSGHHQRQYRLGDDAVQRQQARAIGADAEKSRMTQRDDAGIAEDQIERQRKQRQPHDVGHDQETRGKQERASQCETPERDLAPVPVGMGPRDASDFGRCAAHVQRAAVRPNRPLGRQIRITIMMV